MTDFSRQAVDGALADKLAAARMSLERMRAEYQRNDEWTATLHLNVALAALDDVERALRAGPSIEKPAAKVVPLRRFFVIGPARENEDRFPEVREYEEQPMPKWMERKHGDPDDVA